MLAKHLVVRVALVQTRRTRSIELTGQGPTESYRDEQLDEPKDLRALEDLIGELPDEFADWDTAVIEDQGYQEIREAVREGRRTMPKHLGLKVSIGECSLSGKGDLLFRERRWVPVG